MKKFTSLKALMVVALFFCGLSANAQFTADVEQYANTTYECTSAQFTLSDVAAAVGSDAATLGAALDAWYATDADGNYVNEDTQLFGVLNADGTVNYGYNAAGRGSFWMTTDGTVDGWAAGNVYNDILYYSVDNNYFVIDVGEHDATGATTATLKFALTFNGQQATFTVNYTAKELPSVDPAPTFAKELSVNGGVEVSSEQEPHGDFASTAVSVVVPGITDALGVDDATLTAAVSTMVYAKQYDKEYGLLTDTLKCLGDNGGWTHETVYADGEHTGDPSGIVAWNEYGDGDAYYLDTWAYDAETSTLSFKVGQMPGALKVGQALTCNLYICNGTKAYKVDYTLNIIEPNYQSVDELTLKGSVDLTAELSPSTGSEYGHTTVKVDVDAIAAALGCETSGMALRALAEPGKLATSSTANNGGWWLTLEGYVTAWSTSSGGSVWYIEPVSTTDFSTLTIGEMPDLTEVGDVLTTTLYAISGSNRYDINVTLKIVEPSYEPQNFVSVATRNITIQALSAGYEWSEGKTISNTDIYNALGITGDDAVLYALNTDEDAEKMGQAYTKNYSITEAPGFWVTADGKRTSWGNDSPWGMTTAVTTNQDGVTFQAMQFDGGSEAGTTYKGQFFLVNEETNEMITVNLTYQVVESLDEVEEVGNIAVTVPVSSSDAEVEFTQLPAIAEAIGVENILDGYYLRGMNANSLWSDAVAASTGLTFTTEGYAAEMENIGVYFQDGKICTYSNTEIAEGWKAEAQLCFEANAKRYIINLTMEDENTYETGVNSVKADSKAGKIYTIGGVETSKMVKGVYIQNGKKVVVK